MPTPLTPVNAAVGTAVGAVIIQSQPLINVFGSAMCEIDGFPIDATLTEDHAYENEVTSYPVETGADITDHVRVKPLKITMEGVVSDSPIGLLAAHASRQQNGSPSNLAYAKILRIRDSREPVTIITSLGVYKNMVLDSFSVPRESGEPHQLHFKINFVQIEIVTNARRLVRTSTPGGQKKLANGHILTALSNSVGAIEVFTFKKSNPLDPTKAGIELILTDSNGDRHYEQFEGFPDPDGYVQAGVYHPYSGKSAFGVSKTAATDSLGWTKDPKSGEWLDKKGKPLNKTPPKSLTASNYDVVGKYTATRFP